MDDTNVNAKPELKVMELEGTCACRATRFRLTDAPLFVHACHCIGCQKKSGSVSGITTIMLERDIELDAGSLLVEPMEDAPHRFRHLCSVCRDLIYTTATNHPASALFESGTLNDPREITIAAHICVKQKRPWLSLPQDVPQFEEGYDRFRT